MLEEYRKFYYRSIYNLIKEQLVKISIEFNIDINELEKLYLTDFKEYL